MLPDSLIGQRIKDFVVKERIGRGGMAVVYRAHQPSVQRDVALKIISLNGDHYDDHFRERFQQEAELIARLEHIHILPIYDYGVVDDMAFIAMRLLPGGTLREVLRNQIFTLDRAADLFNQVASGLAYAHRRGVIHRDLKPGNILLDDEGNAYIADFGLAKMVESSLDLTDDDNIIGTPHYMAPEQIRGEHGTPRSDIYSLGILLYEMMVGELPFDRNRRSLISSMYQSLEEAPTPPTELNADIPTEVERVILRAIEKQPERRYATAEQMARELNVALGRSSGIQALRDEPMTDIMSRVTTSRRMKAKPESRWIYILLAFVLFGVVAVGLLAFWLATRGDNETKISDPTILQGESAFASEMVPDDETVRKAGQALGEDGFIGMISCNLSSEYHATFTREITDFARAYNLPVEVYDSDNDAYQEITMIERARAQGAKALIVCPLDNDLLAETLTSSQEAGIRLVFTQADTPTYGGVRMYTDNYLLGKVPGLYAGELINSQLGGDARAVILDYPDIADVVIRANGLEDGVLEAAPRTNILGRYLGGTRDFAYESIKQLLDDNVPFDVILSINDAGAYGAIAALEEAGYQGDEIIIVSVDAENLARQFIQNDHFIRASVPVGRTEAARAAIDTMVHLLAGETVPENVLIEPGPLVTKDSIVRE